MISCLGMQLTYVDTDLTNVTRGPDRFVFANGSGLDKIFDFEDNKDVIDLTGYAGIGEFDQISAHSSQASVDVVIDLSAAATGGATTGVDVLTLSNFALGSLSAADFDFA